MKSTAILQRPKAARGCIHRRLRRGARPTTTAQQTADGRSRLPLPAERPRGRVEDVVVDSATRGRGIAPLLIEQALRIAREAGARPVDLTSRPDRAAANRPYEWLGFRVRESTVYQFPLEPVR